MNITYQNSPAVTTTMLFSDFPFAAVLQAKKLTVEAFLYGKTRVSTNLRHGSSSISANIIPSGSEHLKYHAETVSNFTSRSVKQYFKLSKKQGLPEFEEFIKNLVKQVFKLTDESEFEIVIWETEAIRALREAKPLTHTQAA